MSAGPGPHSDIKESYVYTTTSFKRSGDAFDDLLHPEKKKTAASENNRTVMIVVRSDFITFLRRYYPDQVQNTIRCSAGIISEKAAVKHTFTPR